MARLNFLHSTSWQPAAVYGIVAMAILWPLLSPGFILTLDMVFTPQLRMPEQVTSSYVFHALLHYINVVVPADVIQKGILLFIVLGGMLGMHRLLRWLKPQPAERWGIYVASVFFAVNPFTYARFMAGQYAVLLGYACLPWLARAILAVGKQPTVMQSVRVGLLLCIIATVSIHTLVAVGILLLAGLGIVICKYRARFGSYLRSGVIASGVVLVGCGFWLVPLAMGRGPTAGVIGSFTSADAAVFATSGETLIEKLGNIMRLQGFWAEQRNLFLLPQERVPGWGIWMTLLLGLVLLGGWVMWQQHRTIALWLLTSSVVGIVLAMGACTHQLTAAGLREPHKVLSLVALTYGVFLAYGVSTVAGWTRQYGCTWHAISAMTSLALTLVVARVMLFGFDGQLVPRQYPAGWASANRLLHTDRDHFNVLFLPWHQYMSFQFTGRIIANPAPNYFDKPVIVSTDPELDGASGGVADTQHRVLANILANPSPHMGRQLAAHNIKYILLANTADNMTYNYLADMPDITVVQRNADIRVYKNTAWRESL